MQAHFAEARCDFKMGVDVVHELAERPSIEHTPVGMPVWSSTAREVKEAQDELSADFVFLPCGSASIWRSA